VLNGSCHCGAVHLQIVRRPRVLVACNCSICRRYAALWAYYRRSSVQVRAPRAVLCGYLWGDKTIRFCHCRTCGCVTHYESVQPGNHARVGVNARMLPPEMIAGARIRRFDGADTWKYLDDPIRHPAP